jgi:hypothetical protein
MFFAVYSSINLPIQVSTITDIMPHLNQVRNIEGAAEI